MPTDPDNPDSKGEPTPFEADSQIGEGDRPDAPSSPEPEVEDLLPGAPHLQFEPVDNGPFPPPVETGGRSRKPWVPVVSVVALFVLAGLAFQFLPGSDASSPATTTNSTVASQPGTEPIADAAEIILPSVVFIQVPGGVGSGVIYRSDGLIITAAHVVDGRSSVLVRFSDGSQVQGEVLGSVSEVDIAVIRVDRSDLPPAAFAMEKPRVGQMAVAVGSPWGLAQTVTAGIISAVDQTNCVREVCAAMVQTDAAINPGNSGGALINRFGQVVGINVSILTLTGSNDGVGFAVPSSIAVAYAEAIISGQPLEMAFLGVRITNVTAGDRAGALVTEIFADTGADTAGLEVEDLIVAVAGIPVLSGSDLQAQIRTHRPGSTVELLVIRDGAELVVPVVLGVRAEDL
jgi:S1-C subfamily serine protease